MMAAFLPERGTVEREGGRMAWVVRRWRREVLPEREGW